MAKSAARKWRDKLVREGRRNPEDSRSPFAFADMQTRATKTKKDHLYRNKHKNQPLREGKDGSFYFTRIPHFSILFDSSITHNVPKINTISIISSLL